MSVEEAKITAAAVALSRFTISELSEFAKVERVAVGSWITRNLSLLSELSFPSDAHMQSEKAFQLREDGINTLEHQLVGYSVLLQRNPIFSAPETVNPFEDVEEYLAILSDARDEADVIAATEWLNLSLEGAERMVKSLEHAQAKGSDRLAVQLEELKQRANKGRE